MNATDLERIRRCSRCFRPFPISDYPFNKSGSRSRLCQECYHMTAEEAKQRREEALRLKALKKAEKEANAIRRQNQQTVVVGYKEYAIMPYAGEDRCARCALFDEEKLCHSYDCKGHYLRHYKSGIVTVSEKFFDIKVTNT